MLLDELFDEQHEKQMPYGGRAPHTRQGDDVCQLESAIMQVNYEVQGIASRNRLAHAFRAACRSNAT